MELNWKNTKRILLIVFFSALILAGVLNFGSIFGLIKRVLSFFAPVTAALCVAFVLNVLLTALETKVFKFMDKSRKKFVLKLKRPICLTLTYLIAFGIISLLILVIIPDIIKTITGLAENLPSLVGKTRNWLEGVFEEYNFNKALIPELKVNWSAVANSAKNILVGSYNQIFDGAVSVTTSVFSSVFDGVFSVFISIYILAQKERIGRFVKRAINAFTEPKVNSVIYHVAGCAQESFSRFIGGQLIEAVILGTLCLIGMLILGLPNAVIISVIITVTALVPIVGATVGMFIGFLLIVITDPFKAVLFVIFLFLLQQFEGNVIYPKVVGRVVGLPGVIVVSAVLVGGNIGGVLGALIAVPTSAVLFVLLKELIEYMNNKKSAEKINCEETEQING